MLKKIIFPLFIFYAATHISCSSFPYFTKKDRHAPVIHEFNIHDGNIICNVSDKGHDAGISSIEFVIHAENGIKISYTMAMKGERNIDYALPLHKEIISPKQQLDVYMIVQDKTGNTAIQGPLHILSKYSI